MWQPIETAPKDGSRIIVWWKNFGIIRIAKWHCSGEWFFGDFVMNRAAIPCIDLAENHSHWMPLPEPPA